MSLVIRRIAIENFRKFRDPFTIDNLTDGCRFPLRSDPVRA